MLIERHKTINPSSITEPSEVRIATESYKQNNDIIGQFISEKIIIDSKIKEPRVTIAKLYNDFRIWSVSNVTKGKKCPDRNQLKAYFEKILARPYDNKGWRGMVTDKMMTTMKMINYCKFIKLSISFLASLLV